MEKANSLEKDPRWIHEVKIATIALTIIAVTVLSALLYQL